MFNQLIVNSHHQSQVSKLGLLAFLQQLAQFLAEDSFALLFFALQAEHDVRIYLATLKLLETFHDYSIFLFHFGDQFAKSGTAG